MSHAGPPPPDQPDPSQPDQSQPDQSQPASGEQPWSPYPAGWDQPPQSGPAAPAPYGQPPSPQPGLYPQNPSPQNPYAGTPRPDRPVFGFGGYASWFSRVGAYLIDQFVGAAAALPALIGFVILGANTTTITNPDGSTTSSYDGNVAFPLTLLVIGGITSIAFFVWNICIRQGNTGATVGKSVLAIRLVNADQQPIGPGWAFLRSLLHVVDGICYLGYLWPIWDARKQTFADKIMSTYVIHAVAQEARPY
jgi:uncharacterized RDD family membrane protein YckC